MNATTNVFTPCTHSTHPAHDTSTLSAVQADITEEQWEATSVSKVYTISHAWKAANAVYLRCYVADARIDPNLCEHVDIVVNWVQILDRWALFSRNGAILPLFGPHTSRANYVKMWLGI